MKLCMSLLAERLSPYEPRLLIHDGLRDISGVRFFADELPDYVPGYVYIGYTKGVFEDDEYKNAVLLASGHDMIIVRNGDLETIVNEVLMAFDRYNTWEAALWEASSGEDSLQKMLALCVDHFGGMIGIGNIDGQAIAHGMIEEPDDSDVGFAYSLETGRISNTLMNTPFKTDEGKTVYDMTSKPIIYRREDGMRFIACYLEVDDEYVGSLYIQEKKRPLTEADLKKAEVLVGVITQSITAKKDIGIRSTTSVLIDLIEGKPTTTTNVKTFDAHSSIESPWVTICMSGISKTMLVVDRQLVRTLHDLKPANHPFLYEDHVVSVVSAAYVEDFLRAVLDYIPKEKYAIGISLPFADLEKLQVRYRQARLALDWNEGKAGVFYSQDYSFDYLLQQMQVSSASLELLHPALDILKTHDELHHTELYVTLRRLLDNERNVMATAQDLYIHRNTLMTRIKRIEYLAEVNLDDPAERTYLMLSYFLAE